MTPADSKMADQMAMKMWGRTRTMALNDKVCVRCGTAPDLTLPADEKEYFLSALCGSCWDDMFKDPEDDGEGPVSA